MSCTTLLVGKNATVDGSTYAARNEDAGGLSFDPKKMIVVLPEEQPREYVSVLSGVRISLPDNPMRYTAMPNAIADEGIWGEAGVNACNVSMTATETITSNPRVLGADPLVVPKKGEDGKIEIPGGIGEEDMVTIVLPYIHSAREGVERLGSLLQIYGTYEMNAIAFQDEEEVWWLESIGGHHWMAKRVKDDEYVVGPNQLGIDFFDFEDAYGKQAEHLCSGDLEEFVRIHGLNPSWETGRTINPRECFGSHSDADHVYNTPRAWYMHTYLSPKESQRLGFGPESNFIPWSMKPERKISVEDVKYILSSHFQGTPYDPYGKYPEKGKYRPIGINRNNFLSLTVYRRELPDQIRVVEWVAFGSNTYNAFFPLYANVKKIPAYLNNTTGEVTTENIYWANRLIAVIADGDYFTTKILIERYQDRVASKGRAILKDCDEMYLRECSGNGTEEQAVEFCEKANEKIAAMVKEETSQLLGEVLLAASQSMKNRYNRADS